MNCRLMVVEVEGLVGLNDEVSMKPTIWRLPGGGYAVGRFIYGRQGPGELLRVSCLLCIPKWMEGGLTAGGGGDPGRVL